MKVELERLTNKPEMAVAKAGGISHNNEINNLGEAKKLNRKFVNWGHLSPIEFASATFYVEGVSRSFLSQLSRHRHINLMVESMRYNKMGNIKEEKLRTPPNLPEGNGQKQHGGRKFDTNQEKFITKQYQKGFSTYELADKYNCGNNTIKRLVLEYNGKIRNNREGQMVGIDEDFFEEIDKPIKAYLLGFIYADGWVTDHGVDNGYLQASIDQHKNFESYMKHLARVSVGSIGKSGHKNTVRLNFPGQKIAKDLKKHGVELRKTFKLEYPDIKKEFDHHFIRGYFDGDGSISLDTKSNQLNFTSVANSFLKSVKNKIDSNIEDNMKIRSYQNDRGTDIYQLRASSKDKIKQVVNYIYQNFDLRYCHPKKIKRAIKVSDKIKDRYEKSLIELSKEYEVRIPKGMKYKPLQVSRYLDHAHGLQQIYSNMIADGVPKEDARYILPIGTETKLYVRANFRSWRHIIKQRGLNNHAQWEIRNFAQEVLEYLYYEAESCFFDLMEEYEENFLQEGDSNS